MTAARHWRETRGAASEVKFVIEGRLGERIVDWARGRLPADPHGTGPFGDEYRITSVYFDTDDYDVLHARGSFGRAKYRVRRYGESPEIFLERKLRRPGLLHKRRTLMGVEHLSTLDMVDAPAGSPGHWFHRRLQARRLRPVCVLSYQRIARMLDAGSAGLVRLTVDDEIRAREASEVAFDTAPDTCVLSGRVVLELKFRGDMPALFKALVEEFGVTPTGGSKYRHGMAALGYQATLTGVPEQVQI